MKTNPKSVLLASLLSALAGSSLPAAPAEVPARAVRINAVEQSNRILVEPGTTEFTVRRLLGEPRHKLNPDNWVYDRFFPSDSKVAADDCSTLLVTFAQGKVAELKLVNERAVKVITASLAKKDNVPMVAAK